MTDVIAGRFALCDPIARGGSGVVWRAWDRKQNQFCAAKVLRRRDAGDLLRFVREQSFRLSHHHVLTPYSWAAEDAHVVIASELVEGGSLSTLIGDYGPLAEPSVAVILDQLLEALEQVHGAGLVHRDVKPGNLLLRASGHGPVHAMLGDFGLAMGARDAHLTEVGTVVGTPGYLAPEVLRGAVPPDARQDLYAAGRVAIALLNGVEPRDLGPMAPEARPGLLREVVLALTALDPRARPASATHVRLALRPLLSDPRPFTRSGEAVDVLRQLPPLTDEAIAEAQATEALGADTGRYSGRATPSGSTQAFVGPGAETVRRTAPNPASNRGRSRRLVAVGAVLAATAVAIPVTVALTSSAGDTPRPGPSSIPAGSLVLVGSVCTWQEQGDVEATVDGAKAVCASTSGTYVWTKI